MSRKRIVAVNTSDLGGGAERIACLLHDGLEKRGWDPWLVVGDKKTDEERILAFHESPHIDYRPYAQPFPSFVRRLQKRMCSLSGLQDYHHPFTHRIADITGKTPALVHLHNLHGGYFDLRTLPPLSNRYPTILTLEDCWLFSGHCAYPLGCPRWRTGCGQCPSLHIGPEIKNRDATRWNWTKKKSIYKNSRLYVASPTQWLLDAAMESILAPGIVESRVIPHGVNLSIFKPGISHEARKILDLPENEFIASFAANGTRNNHFKDYKTIELAIKKLGQSNQSILFLAIGESGPDIELGKARIRHIPFVDDPRRMAYYYQASDVYLHAAKNEAFGIVLAEAMACGLPVIATAVDGIPEVLDHGNAGILIPPEDSLSMAGAIRMLMEKPYLLEETGASAAEYARHNFNLETMIDRYEQWYLELINHEL